LKKTGVHRFSASLPGDLLRGLDSMSREKGYRTRSLAIADMIRSGIVEHRQHRPDAEIAGSLTIVYDHHQRNVQSVLTSIQHDHHHLILSTLHVHLDHDNCLEVIVLRGKAAEIKHLAERIIAAKGVKHGKLAITTTGKDLPA
jgi:CopG family transcriptional regulator, nickel-responsive regulator